MTSNDPAGDERRRTSVLCTEGGATGAVGASRMVESRQRSNTCFTRSEGLVINETSADALQLGVKLHQQTDAGRTEEGNLG